MSQEDEDTKPRSGALACPESLMGREPIYVYYDVDCDEFFSSYITPVQMQTKSDNRTIEYIVTLWPRDRTHLLTAFSEVVAFHRR